MLQNFATRELSVEYFLEYAQRAFGSLDKSSTIVEFIVALSERAILSGSNHVYYDPYLLVQLVSGAQGACFMDPEDLQLTDLDNIPGKCAFDLVLHVPTYIQLYFRQFKIA